MVNCPRCEEMLEPPGIPSCSECGYDLSQLPDADAGDMNRTFCITVPVKTNSLSPSQIQSELQNIDAYEFEHFVADLWEHIGWQTKVRQASGDAGVDVIAEKNSPYSQKSVIQAKRYSDSTKVGGPEIQQYASLRQQVANVDAVVIVTTSSFTSSAKSRANDLNVKLINGREIVEILEDSDAYEIADEYIDNREWVKKKVPSQKSSSDFDTEKETQDESQTNSPEYNPSTQPVEEESTQVNSSDSGSKKETQDKDQIDSSESNPWTSADQKTIQTDSSESDSQTALTGSQNNLADISLSDFPFWYLVSISVGAYGYNLVLGAPQGSLIGYVGLFILLIAASIMFLDMLYAGISEDAMIKWMVGFVFAYPLAVPLYLGLRLLLYADKNHKKMRNVSS